MKELRDGGVYTMPNGKEVVARSSSRSGYYLYANPTLIYALPVYEVVATGQIYAAGRPTPWNIDDMTDTNLTVRRNSDRNGDGTLRR